MSKDKDKYALVPDNQTPVLKYGPPDQPTLYHGSGNRELDHVAKQDKVNTAIQTAAAHEAAYGQQLVGALHAHALETKSRIINHAEEVTSRPRGSLAQQRIEAVAEQQFQMAVRDINAVTANATSRIANSVGSGLTPPEKRKGWFG